MLQEDNMGKKIFTAAVVGLGNIGLGYDLAHDKDYVQTHTKAYLNHRGFQLSFGVDPDPKKRAAFERFSRCPSYGSFKDALKDSSSVDILSLCVASEHRNQLWDVIAHMHPKVVVLEKPLAKKVVEGERIISWARKNKIELAVNYIRRFEPSTYVIKAALEKKRLGCTVGVDIRYNGGFYNNASHYIDLMMLFFGKPQKVRHTQVKKNAHDFDVDFNLEYPSFEVHGRSVDTNCPVGEITIWCENGKFVYQKFGQQIDVFEAKPDPVFRKFNELAFINTIEAKTAYALGNMAENVYRFCCGESKLLSDGKNAFEALRLCENILSKR
jgi:predicted dehydrogenase